VLNAFNPLEKFLNSLHSDDLINIPARKHFLSKEINATYHSIHEALQKVKSEKEEQFHLFKTSINHASSGIIVYNQEGKVHLINKAALKMLELKHLGNVRKLSNYKQDFPDLLLDNNTQKSLIKFKAHDRLKKISVQIQDFVLKNQPLRVASLQNISDELEKEELLAWKKLLHVITHEIMNSVTPMKTLSYSLHTSFAGNENPVKKEEFTDQDISDLREGLNAINTRISGLEHFVESYRKLYKIPEPSLDYISIQKILEETKSLFRKELEEKTVEFTISGHEVRQILADKEMIAQVLINLVKNAVEAIRDSENPKIEITVLQDNQETAIRISDNGSGMNEEELQNCFIPFYTTKEDGSGIGLYYSRMIALLHKGNLTVQSELEAGSTFTLTL
jgi:signal transduction histidine kinase